VQQEQASASWWSTRTGEAWKINNGGTCFLRQLKVDDFFFYSSYMVPLDIREEENKGFEWMFYFVKWLACYRIPLEKHSPIPKAHIYSLYSVSDSYIFPLKFVQSKQGLNLVGWYFSLVH